jgi:hypothetical protein
MLDGQTRLALWFPTAFLLGAILQWMLLDRVVPGAERWVIATPVAALAVAFPNLILQLMVGENIANSNLSVGMKWVIGIPLFALIGGMTGAVVGIGQWLVLRRSLSRAGWWIGISALGWGLATGALTAFLELKTDKRVTDPLANWLVPLAIGVVCGGVTGRGVLWLLGQARPVGDDSTPQSNS